MRKCREEKGIDAQVGWETAASDRRGFVYAGWRFRVHSTERRRVQATPRASKALSFCTINELMSSLTRIAANHI